jgi:hypothetical protein
MSNSTAVIGYAAAFVRPDPKGDLAAYDQLPPDVRYALDNALFEISAKDTLRFWKKHGTDKTLVEVELSNQQFREACQKERAVRCRQ